jgi:hypothetical protein
MSKDVMNTSEVVAKKFARRFGLEDTAIIDVVKLLLEKSYECGYIDGYTDSDMMTQMYTSPSEFSDSVDVIYEP